MNDLELALSVLQPWASAIVTGPEFVAPDPPKLIENRVWSPPKGVIGKRIWIHAAKRRDDEGYASAAKLWPWLEELGASQKRIARRWGAEIHYGRFPNVHRLPTGAIIGCVRVVDVVEAHASPWFVGPFGWVLSEARALKQPISCRGAQKLWRVPAQELRWCLDQVA
jgi:hypothetical protein